MNKSQYDPLPIFAIAVGVVASSVNASGGFGLWDTMIGIIMGILLLSFRDFAKGGGLNLISYSALVGFCMILVFGFIGDQILFPQCDSLEDFRDVIFFVAWVLLSSISYFTLRPRKGAS